MFFIYKFFIKCSDPTKNTVQDLFNDDNNPFKNSYDKTIDSDYEDDDNYEEGKLLH